MSDPFNTAAIRATVLAGWQADPARFREDANAEEDFARGYYRDRVLVELAQNAADAASAANVAGELLLRLTADERSPSGWTLLAANTGSPLTNAGVKALATLRASAKLADADVSADADTDADAASPSERHVGRFGVGFAAVRAVSDHISVASTAGAVKFSVAQTATLLAAAGADNAQLARQVARRDGDLPALRLPLPAPNGTAPPGYVTAVSLRLRDETSVALITRLLADVDDKLLLALPGLARITIQRDGEPDRVLADVASRWHITERAGRLPPNLLDTLPVEERSQRAWYIRWATPRAAEVSGEPQLTIQPVASGQLASVLCAPTPTDEPLTVPAVLIGSFPMEPTRRRVRTGEVASWLLAQAAEGYAEHARTVAEPLELVPMALPAGPVDAELHALITAALARTPLLLPLQAEPDAAASQIAGEPGDVSDELRDTRALIAPQQAVVVVLQRGTGGGLVGAIPVVSRPALGTLAAAVPDCVDIPRELFARAAAVGVTAVEAADAVGQLPLGRTATQWRGRYDDLMPLINEPGGREALASLPVPLAGGRIVTGPRGVLLFGEHLPQVAAQTLAGWGVRISDPGAVHPLLEALGALPVAADDLLDEPAIRRAVEELADPHLEPEAVATILTLVQLAVSHRHPAEKLIGPIRPWLPDLPLLDDEDQPCGAGGLVLGGSEADRLFDPAELGVVSDDLVEQWGQDVLRAVGVRGGLTEVRGTVDLDPWVPGAAIDFVLDDPGVGILDRIDEYVAYLIEIWQSSAGATEPVTIEIVALADLDVVRPELWPEVERTVDSWLVSHGGDVRLPGGEVAPNYIEWWLANGHRARH